VKLAASAYQVKRCGIPAKPLQARSDTVYTEGCTDGYEGRPTYFSCLQTANSRVNVVKPAHMCSWKQVERLEYNDGPDGERLQEEIR
jgi:hypothetical protein